MTLKRLSAVLMVGCFWFAEPLQAQASQTCVAEVTVNDHLHFKPEQIDIPASCEQFTVVLKHEGRLPKVASPRNWVLTAAKDANAVARDASAAGQDNGWVMPEDERVLVASPIVGRQQSASIEIPLEVLAPDQTYVYLCTVPGFSPTMRGQLRMQSH